MLKIITGIKHISEAMKVLTHLEEHGYKWMWAGLPEGVLPTRFIGWKFLFVQHRRISQNSMGICMSLDEDSKQILDLGPWKPPIEEYCQITFNDFLYEITPMMPKVENPHVLFFSGYNQ